MRLFPGVVVSLFFAQSALAQVLPSDIRLRASIPSLSAQPLIGRMAGLSVDSLWLRNVHGYTPEGTYFAPRIVVTRSQVPKLEYFAGRNREQGALIGGLIGAIAPLVSYYTQDRYKEYRGLTAALVGGIAIPIGVALGAAFGPDKWEPVQPWP